MGEIGGISKYREDILKADAEFEEQKRRDIGYKTRVSKLLPNKK
ncbi:hypothetical protein [Desulfuribacillus stibiiarsenatis]|nr:hypothetical protein [Desulfuribacillus stibiiarsenatis]